MKRVSLCFLLSALVFNLSCVNSFEEYSDEEDYSEDNEIFQREENPIFSNLGEKLVSFVDIVEDSLKTSELFNGFREQQKIIIFDELDNLKHHFQALQTNEESGNVAEWFLSLQSLCEYVLHNSVIFVLGSRKDVPPLILKRLVRDKVKEMCRLSKLSDKGAQLFIKNEYGKSLQQFILRVAKNFGFLESSLQGLENHPPQKNFSTVLESETEISNSTYDKSLALNVSEIHNDKEKNVTMSTIINKEGLTKSNVLNEEVSTTGNVMYEEVSTKGNVMNEEESTTGNVMNEEVSTTGNVMNEEKSTTGNVMNEEESTTGNVMNEEKSTTGNVMNEENSTTGNVMNEENSTTGNVMNEEKSTTHNVIIEGLSESNIVMIKERSATDNIIIEEESVTDNEIIGGRSTTDIPIIIEESATGTVTNKEKFEMDKEESATNIITNDEESATGKITIEESITDNKSNETLAAVRNITNEKLTMHNIMFDHLLSMRTSIGDISLTLSNDTSNGTFSLNETGMGEDGTYLGESKNDVKSLNVSEIKKNENELLNLIRMDNKALNLGERNFFENKPFNLGEKEKDENKLLKLIRMNISALNVDEAKNDKKSLNLNETDKDENKLLLNLGKMDMNTLNINNETNKK